MDAEDGRGRVKKIKATATPTSVTSKLPTRKITTPPKERSQNPFVSDTDIAKYDIIQQKITNL
jgi:hypothetical protein